MQATMYRVLEKSEVTMVNGKPGESSFEKATYHLRTLDGDEILAVAFREDAKKNVKRDDIVGASLWFSVREFDDRKYMDARIREIIPLEPKIEL